MKSILQISLVLGALALSALLPARCLAQVTPTVGDTITVTSPLKNATTYTVNSTAVAVRKDRGLGIFASLTPAGATNAVTLNFEVSNDKTNWASATPFSLSQNLTTATTNYIAFTNFPATAFNNVTWWRLATITAANTNAITNAIS